MSYNQIAFGDIYGSSHYFSVGIGINYVLHNKTELGMSVQNMNQSKISQHLEERAPTVFIFGIKQSFDDDCFGIIELEKKTNSLVNFKFGIEITINKIFDFRCGVNTHPFSSALGVGFSIKKLNFNMSFSWQSKIGLSPSTDITYRIK